jgi:ATP/maltotriose-dependent transcriptional regulator MalT
VLQDLALEPTGGQQRSERDLQVERSALVERLTATQAPLILVEAPAGYGKTTIVAQWRARLAEARPFAWVTLSRADNEPRNLWRHITRALLRACPELEADQVLCELRAVCPDITGTVIPLLVNQLAARTAPAVLVLDDYHRVSEPQCHEQVTFLLDHLPASVRVVLVTRTDPPPPLPLARWRANGAMAEFKAGDLRFAEAETAPLVRAASGLELSRADLARLVELTEGWPTGLYLLALSLRGCHSPAARVRQCTETSPVIASFMAEEVLSRQPAAIRRFLAQTSVLTRFCAPLCDAVTESADGAEILAILERENAFIVPLDQSRQWFRYHHLFTQVLRNQLHRTEPGIVPVLHQRASEWHRRSGSASAAIDHAIAANDRAGAIALIAANWPTRAASGEGRAHEARCELEHALHLCLQIPGINVWGAIDIVLRLAMAGVDVGDRSSAAALAREAGLLLAAAPGEAPALLVRLEQLERRLEGWPRAQGLADPLTAREVNVLQQLRSALPLREIAADLGLSVNTIKTQVRSVYRKLGVSGRRDALTRGRQLGILQPSYQL